MKHKMHVHVTKCVDCGKSMTLRLDSPTCPVASHGLCAKAAMDKARASWKPLPMWDGKM